MKNRIITITSILLLVSMMGTACGHWGQIVETDLMAETRSVEWTTDPEPPTLDFVGSVNTFSWNLMETITRNSATSNIENPVVSPVSVYIALSMAINGANGQTRTDILKALSASQLTVDSLNVDIRNWNSRISQPDGATRFRSSNSIWYDDGFIAAKEFLQTNADYFAASMHSLDFMNLKAKDPINKWVNDATEGRIKTIIDKVNSDAVMYLVNAILFDAEWKDKFKSEETRQAYFRAAAGDVAIAMMQRHDLMDYLKIDGAEGVLLPYGTGRFGFVALLPDEGTNPRALFSLLTGSQFDQLIDQRQTKEISLSIPKFKVDCSMNLKSVLGDLGMSCAFDSGLADFSLMQDGGGSGLFIDDVIHKSFISVDEDGTKAGAATAVIATSEASKPDVEIVLNRPFLYSIVDLETNLPLFIGILENPMK